MEDIPVDPVVMYYLKTCTDKDEVYSDMRLRLALSQLLNKNQMFTFGNLKMYERLLVLYYSFMGRTVEEIQKIMPAIYDLKAIRSLLETENRNKLIRDWRQFQKKNLIDVVYREAADLMLQEWHYRCLLQQQRSGETADLTVAEVSEELNKILEFLHWDMRNRQKFTSSMWRFLKDESTIKQPLRNGLPICLNLNTASLFEAVKEQLSPWLVGMVERGERQCTGPVRPVLPVSQFLQLKRLPNGTTSAESGSPSAKKSSTPKTRIIVQVEEPTNYDSDEDAPLERFNFRPRKVARVERKPIKKRPVARMPVDEEMHFQSQPPLAVEKEEMPQRSVAVEEKMHFKQQKPLAMKVNEPTILTPQRPLVFVKEPDEISFKQHNPMAVWEVGMNFKPLTEEQQFMLQDAMIEFKSEDAPKVEPINFQPLSFVQIEMLHDSQKENENSSPAFEIDSPALEVADDGDNFEKIKYENVIDLKTALSYIEQLKIFALANERFEALDPLEQVEACFYPREQ